MMVVLGTAVAFALAYGQAPLFYSNQNQYLLHGYAWAGYGLLSEDWLASTLDPTPVYSALVAFTVRYLHPWAFYVYQAFLYGVYAAALLGLFDFVVGREVAVRRWPFFVLAFVALHSGILRWASYRYLGLDYPWYFQAGVAGQYVLGGMFQPSVFGVLLIAAVSLFVRERPLLAAVAVAAAGTIHPTYLLPGALLTLGFLTVLIREGRTRTALAIAALTLVLVLPTVGYSVWTFRPASAETFATAQDILVNLRIPHHSRIDLWLDKIAILQIVWIVFGLAAAWRTRLFLLVAVTFTLAAVLTVIQAFTDHRGLALLFPWRMSAFLIPIATTLVLARLTAIPGQLLDGTTLRGMAVGALALLAIVGVVFSVSRFGFHTSDEELAVLDFVRSTKSAGDVYFLPVRVPNLAVTTRGSSSHDYRPLAQKRRDGRIIPVDLQRFRLYTGSPVFVDFKSIPYRDVDLIEWRDRLREAESVLDWLEQDRVSEAVATLRARGVTHVLTPATVKLNDGRLREVYADEYYRVFRIEEGA